MRSNANVRIIKENELEQLLLLYKHLNPEDPEVNLQDIQNLWYDIIHDPLMKIIVVEYEEQIISSCVLVMIKNLTRGARPYALIENVVTHPDYRLKGYGKLVLIKAIEIAKANNCYKVMLMTSGRLEGTYRFYEQCGFNSEDKTGFDIRLS